MAASLEDTGGEIFVNLDGTGQFSGASSNVVNYSYTEGSTPLIPGDESGAVGDVSIEVVDKNDASILLYKDNFYLQDNVHGAMTGSVESVSGDGVTVTMGGRSRLANLNVDAIIPPRTGNIGDVLQAVMAQLGESNDIIKDANLSTETINAPGHEGDAWVYIKQLCSAYKVDVAVIREYIFIRPARQRTIDASDILDRSWQIQDIELAQEFDVAYYNYQQRTDYLVYPEGGWTPEVQVYQVAANETTEFEIELDFFLTSVQQPSARDSVSKDYGTASVYAVSGNDNLPVSAAFWDAYKGDMSFEILGDGSRVKVTIVGPKYEPLSPYTIGISDGSTSYSTLRMVGTGLDFNRLLYTESTGLTSAQTATVKGAEIDNPAIDTLDDAKQYALFARRLYSLPTQTYSTSSNTFPRLEGSIPSIFYTTFEEFNASLNPGYTFNNFNSDYALTTFADLTAEFGNVAPQGFGEVAGSRVKLDDALYRVRSTTITPDIVSFDAEYDTLISDINDVYIILSWADLQEEWNLVGTTWNNIQPNKPQKTFEDFNTTFDSVTFKDFALMPVRELPVFA